MANSVTLNGLKGFQLKIEDFKKSLKEDLRHELAAAADNIVRGAKRNFSTNQTTDQGVLANSISKKKTGDLEYTVYVGARYAAYVEFGTGARVDVPAGYEAFAAQFKGSSGSGSLTDFFTNILDWVKSKGIAGTYSVKSRQRVAATGRYQSKAYVFDQEDRQAAYAIMRSILIHGAKPHPFFIPAIEAEKPELIARVKKIVTDLK